MTLSNGEQTVADIQSADNFMNSLGGSPRRHLPTTPMTRSSSSDSIKRKTIHGIGYKGGARFVSYGLQAVTTVILAQNLSAEDYGIVGFAMIFIGFLANFNELGIGSAVVQRKELTKVVLNTAFAIRVLLGALAFAIAWLIAPLAASRFGNEALTHVMRVLSAGFVIGIVGFVPSLLLLRELEFKRWVVATLSAALLRTVLVCSLALHGYGYWSIVIGNVASSAIEALGFMCLCRYLPSLEWDARIARELCAFGAPLFTSGLLVFALFNADNLIVGSVAGAVALGYYAVAFNWGAIFSKLIYEVFHTVLFPAFSRVQDDRVLLRRVYLRMMEQLSLFGILIQGGLLTCSRDFLVMVLDKGGPKWLPACHALQILSIYGLVRLLVEPLGNLLVALGSPKLIFRANCIATACEISLLYPALKFGGIEAVAVLVTVCYTLQWVVYWPFVARKLDVSASDMRNSLLPSMVAVIPAACAALALEHWYAPGFMCLFAKALVFTAVFVPIQGTLSSWRWVVAWKEVLVHRPAAV